MKLLRLKCPVLLLKSVQVMVRLHIFPIFSFLAKMLSFLLRDDNIFARNENIGKICKQTITWTDFSSYTYLNLPHFVFQDLYFGPTKDALTKDWNFWYWLGDKPDLNLKWEKVKLRFDHTYFLSKFMN